MFEEKCTPRHLTVCSRDNGKNLGRVPRWTVVGQVPGFGGMSERIHNLLQDVCILITILPIKTAEDGN